MLPQGAKFEVTLQVLGEQTAASFLIPDNASEVGKSAECQFPPHRTKVFDLRIVVKRGQYFFPAIRVIGIT